MIPTLGDRESAVLTCSTIKANLELELRKEAGNSFQGKRERAGPRRCRLPSTAQSPGFYRTQWAPARFLTIQLPVDDVLQQREALQDRILYGVSAVRA